MYWDLAKGYTSIPCNTNKSYPKFLENQSESSLSSSISPKYEDSMYSINCSTLSVYNKNGVATPFKCNLCSKEYPSFLQLKRHVKIHSVLKSYVCDVCSKAFIQSIDLVRHKRIHSGERPFKCYLCEYSAVQESHLLKHLKRKH